MNKRNWPQPASERRYTGPDPWEALINPVKNLSGVGPKRAQLLAKLDIETIYDLLTTFPRRWERRRLTSLNQLRQGETVVVKVIVKHASLKRPKKGLSILEARVADAAGEAVAIWFNQAYLAQKLKPGKELVLTGVAEYRFQRWQIGVKEYNLDGELPASEIEPIYPLTAGINQRLMRNLIQEAVRNFADNVPETLPAYLLERYQLMPLGPSLRAIHMPAGWERLAAARRRFIWEELFILQLGIMLQGERRAMLPGINHRGPAQLVDAFLQNLPFALTRAQQKVLEEIWRDMESPRPMSRLIQGDVGSGKTVVAAGALVKAAASGHQGVMMAPTEILAQQHYQTLKSLLGPLGLRVACLTGGTGLKEKEKILQAAENGEVDLLVGTQALIQERVAFKRLGLTIADEQHRFGVRQRASLKQKGNPDLLLMSATPIPRTLAMTIYGDLDLSVLDELPPGRSPVATHFIPDHKREGAWGFIKGQIRAGRQAYVICPLVEENEELDLKAATAVYEELKKRFRPYAVELLHGKMKGSEKNRVMDDFAQNRVQLLVSTTVVEVGVNVPNATIMVVEGVERFGLAQLHQLRGRVGRGGEKSYCFLMGNPRTEISKERVKVLLKTTNGFTIAEEDLKLRGPGDLFGTKQHGLPELKIADLAENAALLPEIRGEAMNLVREDPELAGWPDLKTILNHKFQRVMI